MFPEPAELLLIGLFDRINLDSKIQIKYIDSKNQLADILTQGNFTRDEWNHLLSLFNISHFSSTSCLEVMAKRTQKDSGEERVSAKSKPMMNLVSRCSERNPDVLASTAPESPGKTRYECHLLLSSWNEQHLRTGRLDKEAYSSSYSEWNADEKWSSQEWKSDEVMEVRTGRLVCEQPPGLFTRLLWEKQFEKNLLQHGWEKVSNWECLFVHRQKGLFLSVYVDDIKLAGKKQNINPMWKVLNNEVDLGEPTSFLDHIVPVVYSETM